MDMTLQSCRSFVEALAAPAPTPGGGGAAALVGALGTALGHMAANLTLGKPQYAAVQEEIRAVCTACRDLEQQLLDQVAADEENFLPLAAAYRLPKDAPDRDAVLEEATLAACRVPLQILKLCARALDCMALVAEKGTRLALSDAGSGAVLCRAAMEAAALTVFINTRALKNRSEAAAIDTTVHEMLADYGALADRIYRDVCRSLGQ